MNFAVVIAWVGVFQGLFLSATLFLHRRKNTNSSHFILATLLLMLTLHNIDSVFTYSQAFYDYPHFFAVKDPFVLTYGPLLFLYITSLFKRDFRLNRYHLLHFIPMILFALRLLPLYLKGEAYKLAVLDMMYLNYEQVRDVEINLLLNAHIFLYFCFSAYYYLKHKPSFPYITRPIRNRYTSIGLILLVTFLIYTVSMIRFFTTFDQTTVLWLPLMLSLCLFAIAYRSLAKSNLLVVDIPLVASPVTHEKQMAIMTHCEELIENEKLYLRTDLNLTQLAKMLETNRQYLSEAISLSNHEGFVNYINAKRVLYSKNLLKSDAYNNYSMERVAEDSGFNSLSSFNRAFKRFTGKTPSQFRGES